MLLLGSYDIYQVKVFYISHEGSGVRTQEYQVSRHIYISTSLICHCTDKINHTKTPTASDILLH